MPELPEVETVRRDLERSTLHQTIASVEVLLDRTIAHPSPADFCSRLSGQQLVDWQRRGKYLLGELSSGDRLGVHLRMTGQLLWLESSDEPVHKHTRVRMAIAQGRELRFNDCRTFGQIWLVPSGIPTATIVTGLAKLGPEPLSPEFSEEYFYQQLQTSRRPIKNALLDQRLVAGVGNIYADEALFLAQTHPQTPCDRFTRPWSAQLRACLIQVLSDSIEQRGTSFSSYRDLGGVNGNYLGHAWVYSRKGKPCRRCDGEIVRIKLAGRSAHFCPNCQFSSSAKLTSWLRCHKP
ncbi:DNA-formamidopyrimidine glycosylase [Synechococcus sp. PCC 7336]|uniref:DNA-formamidopyrimidine glycosylase n=1 Tax=Synechococcus sp. PCC 7336 TaxID=195250 RepID=UPI000348DB52|nr:DNA-formamidopyrimidine glycosylase [Synechococcus sp. PCC 7336]